MNTVKFRENALTAVTRDDAGITIYVRRMTEKEAAKVGKPELATQALEPIRLRYSDCSETVLNEAKGYGMEVRLTRAAAIEHAKAGRPATAQERHDAIKRLADHYGSGTDQWNMAGGGGGGLNADTKALVEALCDAFGLDAETAEEQVRNMSQDERAALRGDPEIKAALDAVYARRGASADVSALKAKLAGLKK